MITRPLLLGVDPGFSGALAWYNCHTQKLVNVCAMPVLPGNEHFGDKRPRVDGASVSRIVKSAGDQLALIVMEKVESSPNMGVVSAFRFGQGFGVLQGVFSALGAPVRDAYPSAWKAGMGLTKNKKDSLLLACKLFPEWAATFRKDAASADLAEAALLAKFGERFLPKNVK